MSYIDDEFIQVMSIVILLHVNTFFRYRYIRLPQSQMLSMFKIDFSISSIE